MKHLKNIVLIQIWKQNIFLHTIFFIITSGIINKYIKLNCNVKEAKNDKKRNLRNYVRLLTYDVLYFLLGLIEIEKDIQL